AAFLARRAEGVLLVLELLRFRVAMRGRKLDLVGAGAEEGARRLADAGRHARRVAGGEIEHVDLIERVAGLAFALEHDPLAVRCPVAFAGAFAFHRQAPYA